MDEIITIDLFGEEFKFRPDGQVENPGDVAQHLKKYITEAEQLLPGKKTTGKTKLATLLLAAMNLSRDFQELKQEQERLKQLISSRISSTIGKIDKGIELF